MLPSASHQRIPANRDIPYSGKVLLKQLALLLNKIPGIARRSAERIIAETGIEMKQFRNSDYFASWAGLVPGCNESARKKKSFRIRKGNLFLKSILVECAHSASRHKDSYFYVKYCKISACRGGKRAIVAIAHSMALMIYHILLN